jgi:hypothetical protein
MKCFLITFFAVSIALWGGYLKGYHNGGRDSDSKWCAAIHVDPDGRFVVGALSEKLVNTRVDESENSVTATFPRK